MTRWVSFAGMSTLAIVAAAWANWPLNPLPDGTVAGHVVVLKSERRLQLYHGPELIRAYRISLGRNPVGPKQQIGDGRTPEGDYHLDYRKADSSFHRALHISYPSASDSASARARGVEPGGLIMVHGMKNHFGWIGRAHRAIDWTDGCVAVTNREIEEIWRVVPDGTPITIKP
jgi:murein L,D-transpeptidase YafK